MHGLLITPPRNITISKITCGQKCLKGYNCHSCYNGLNIGNYEKLKGDSIIRTKLYQFVTSNLS